MQKKIKCAVLKFMLCLAMGIFAYLLTCPSAKTLAAQDSENEDEIFYKDEFGGIHTVNGFVYYLHKDVYVSTYSVRYEGSAEHIAIPSEFQGLKVTSLFSEAFSEAPNLKSVTLPESISDIDAGAFNACKKLEEILVDENNPSYTSQDGVLYEMDNDIKKSLIFCPVKKLKTFTIPKGVERLESYAFNECKDLQSVHIPSSVAKIGSAFDSTDLQNIYYGGSREQLENTKDYYDFLKTAETAHFHYHFDINSYESAVLSDDTAEISGYRGTDRELFVPAGLGDKIVSSIGKQAFSGCETIVCADIPDNITHIGDGAFFGCGSLERAIIPAGIQSLGNGIFDNCPNLKELYYAGSKAQWESLKAKTPDETKIIFNCNPHDFILDSDSLESQVKILRYIGDNTDIVIPAWLDGRQVTGIGNSYATVFENSAPKRIEILNGITRINDLAFSGCESLEEIKLPETCESIGEEAFALCGNLKKIELPEKLTTMGQKAFYQCAGLTGEISFPETLTCLAASAFEDCENLTRAVLPENLKEINAYVFSGCKNLADISLPKNVTYIGVSAFWGCAALKDVYYSGTGKEWKEFINSEGFVKAGNDCLLNAGFHYVEEDLGVPSGYFTVSFNAQGVAEIPSQTILQFGYVKKPEDPVRSDYVFDGWYYGDELWDFEFDRIRGDMTLEARWTNKEAVRQDTAGNYIDQNGFMLIPLGKDFILNSGKPAYSSNITYNWSADKPNLVQMGQNGSQSIPMKGIAEGQCTLTCAVRSELYRIPPYGTELVLWDVDTSFYPYKYRIVSLISSLKMTETSITMEPDTYHPLTLTAAPTDNNYARTLSNLCYTSSDSSIVEVSKDGILKAKKDGTVTVTAYTTNGMDGITGRDTCTVTVKNSRKEEPDKTPSDSSPDKNGDADNSPPHKDDNADNSLPHKNQKNIPALKIVTNTKQIYMVKGKSVKVKASVSPSNTTDKVAWSSSNKKIATVKNGKITAKKTGKTAITAKAGKKKAVIKVYVISKEKKATKVTLKKKATLKVKKTLTLKAAVSPKKSTDTLKWSSSNKKTAKVDQFGNVTALKKGKTVITVKTSSGKKASCKITVK